MTIIAKVNKNLLIIVFLTCFVFAHAQHTVGVKIYSGQSIMDYGPVSLSGEFMLDYKSPIVVQPGGGIYYNFEFSNHMLFGSELLYNQTGYKEQYHFTTPLSSDSELYEKTFDLDYITVPIYFGYRAERWAVNLGAVPMILLNDHWKSTYKASIDGETTSTSDDSKIDIDKYDIGIRIGLVYTIFKRWHIEGYYTRGINNLFVKGDEDTEYDYLYNHQFTVGVCYDIFK